VKLRTKNTLRALAQHLGLKVIFVSYLAPNVHGRLLVREKRILINAHKPRHEHIFTLLHEIGHFVQHVLNVRHWRHPRIFDTRWRIDFLTSICSQARRYFRYIFATENAKEWEADLWAMCAFVYLVKMIGGRDELAAFLKHHPEKRWSYRLAVGAAWYCELKKRLQFPCKLLAEVKRRLSARPS
jgi:hypothetical protein